MDIKKKEFLNLTQGSRNVMAYVNAFNTLSQYAPEEVATDAKKQECLYDGSSRRAVVGGVRAAGLGGARAVRG